MEYGGVRVPEGNLGNPVHYTLGAFGVLLGNVSHHREVAGCNMHGGVVHGIDVRHAGVEDMIDELMKVDVTVANYHRLLRTHKLSDTIHAYRMVDEVCKKYVGRLLPMAGSAGTTHKITETDIAKGLGADDPHGFLAECRETLWLLDMYGERGKRDAKPQVVEMLKDTHRSDFSAKQLLKFLREIDALWMREHSEGGGSGDNPRSMSRMT